MTKTVRIENADTSDWKVKVIVQDLRQVGPAAGEQEWVTTETLYLGYPTAMTNNLYLTSTRRFIVEEDGVSDNQFYDKKYVRGLEESVRLMNLEKQCKKEPNAA